MKRNRKTTYGLHMRMWLYFLVLAIIIIVMIWALQIAFLRTYYNVMKTHQIIEYGNSLVGEFDPDAGIDGSFKDHLYTMSFNNGISARIFSSEGKLEYSPEIEMFRNDGGFIDNIMPGNTGGNFLNNNINNRHIGEGFTRYGIIIETLERSGKDHITFKDVDQRARSNSLVYAATLKTSAGTVHYLTITSVLAPIDATCHVLQSQLILVTIISLLMAFLLSYFFAKKLAKPIVNITKSAKELGKGNYSVEFERSNYTEIDELAQVLNNTARELAKTDTLRRDLMANVSHDLRTPMTIIKSYAEMIRDLSGNIPEKRTAHTQVIIDESDRLQALVNDILDLSKLEAGTARITSEEFNISREVKEIVNRFHVFSETQGYTFTEDIDDDLFVFADEHTIAQVIYNLISNAVNYTGDDKKVEISLKRNGNKVKFSVKDTGDGIKPEEQELVWQRYYRASESHKRTKIGTGVGLSIVHNILENHKATYGIDSTYGEGSIFWFELPLIE